VRWLTQRIADIITTSQEKFLISVPSVHRKSIVQKKQGGVKTAQTESSTSRRGLPLAQQITRLRPVDLAS